MILKCVVVLERECEFNYEFYCNCFLILEIEIYLVMIFF